MLHDVKVKRMLVVLVGTYIELIFKNRTLIHIIVHQ